MITTKNYTIFKYTTIALIIVFSFSSCESDFENAGASLVNNGIFDTEKKDFDVISYTRNLEKSRVDNISAAKIETIKQPLGVFDNQDFGVFKASIIAQINAPTNLSWGESPNLDAVFLEIPYDATSDGKEDDGKPKFKLNNVYGDQDIEFQIKVSRLDDYLTKLDPIDPTKAKKYFSNEVFNTSDELYPWTDFKPNAKDTVLYFDRTLLDVAANAYAPIQVEDTIKANTVKPFIRIPLNKTFFENNFINNPTQAVFDNAGDFNNFFRGIAIQVQGNDGSVVMLDIATANIKLYLTNTEDKTADETTVDLNGDGDTDDTGVTYPVRTKKTIAFPLRGIKTSTFERDYTNASGVNQITTPNNMVDGEQKLYVQGAAGSIAVIDLFAGEDLTILRNKNWLINEANLTFHIETQNENNLPNRLLLYKLDPDLANDINENEHILDAVTEGKYFNGFLQKDGDDPTKYKVTITDYISEVLKKEDYTESVQLGLKLYNGMDKPLTIQDIIISDYSWNPQGVVLFGNNYQETDTNYNKRLKLEVYYTELNN